MEPELIRITDRISYIPASEKPLSSDIGIIRGDSATYFYDLGSLGAHAEYLNSISGRKEVVLSHFHSDHTTMLPNVVYDRLYAGNATMKSIKHCISAETFSYASERLCTPAPGSPVHIDDGISLDISYMPCTHAKGSLVLTVNNEYCFIGDATYCLLSEDRPYYNAQLLKDEIETLKSIDTEYCLVSHDKHFIRPKSTIIRQLEAIYGRRTPNEPLIFV